MIFLFSYFLLLIHIGRGEQPIFREYDPLLRRTTQYLSKPIEYNEEYSIKQFFHYEISEKNELRRNVESGAEGGNVFDKPSIIPVNQSSDSMEAFMYRYLFNNVKKYSSNFVLYPYPIRVYDEELHGVVFSTEKLTRSDFQKINLDSNITFSSSKALYDTSIAVLKVEYFDSDMNIPRDLFFESDKYCQSTLTYLGHWGKECLYSNNFFPQAAKTQFVYLEESDCDLLTIENFGVLFIPDIQFDSESMIIDKLTGSSSQTCSLTWKDRILKYMNDGGLVFSSGSSSGVLQELGIFENQVVHPLKESVNGKFNNEAIFKPCESTDPLSPDYSDFIKQTLCMTQLDKKPVYLASSYRMYDTSEFTTLLEFDNEFMVYKSFKGAKRDVGNSDTLPAILHKSIGAGNLIIMNANPAYSSSSRGWIFNTLFIAMSKNFLYNTKIDFERENIEENPCGNCENNIIPGQEAGVMLDLKTEYHNVFRTALTDFSVEIILPHNIKFVSYDQSICTNSSSSLNVSDFNIDLQEKLNFANGHLRCFWPQIDEFSRIDVNIKIEITDGSVTQQKYDCLIAYSSVSYYTDLAKQHFEEFKIGELTIDAELAAVIRANSNPDPSSFYPIPGRGVYIDNVITAENKESTAAYSVEYSAIVPIITPAVDGNDQRKIIEVATFWNEYYTEDVNKHMEYPFPFKKMDPEDRDFDILDFKFLAEKDVYLNANWDTEGAVKIKKIPRDGAEYPEIPINEFSDIVNMNYSTNNDNLEVVYQQIYFGDSDMFYEHATQQLLVFLDTTKEKGALAKYPTVNNSEIPDIPVNFRRRGYLNRTKTEYVFVRTDIYFYESGDQYILPEHILPNHVITIDRYPNNLHNNESSFECYDTKGKVVVEGYFDKNRENGGLKANEYDNALISRCGKEVLKYDDIESFTNNSIQKVNYYFPIIDEDIKRPSDLLGFDVETGHMTEYPEIQFVYCYTFTILIYPNITRKGGMLQYNFSSPKNISVENIEISYSADHVAFYDTQIDVSNDDHRFFSVKSYFKRGLMPNEAWGKPSINSIIINLGKNSFFHPSDETQPDFKTKVSISEMKYDLSSPKTQYEEYIFRDIVNVNVSNSPFFKLPAIKLNFKLERGEEKKDLMNPYELIEPIARYGVYYQELIGHRTVWGLSESHLISDPGLVSLSGGFSVVSQVGISSIPFIDYLTVGENQVIPAAMETTRIQWKDIWGRKWIQPLRSVFPDVPPIPPPLRNFMMTTTFEVVRPNNNNLRALEWISDEDLEIRIKIKLSNNYPKYFEITTCEDNEVFSILENLRNRIFSVDIPVLSNVTNENINKDDNEYLSLGHRAFYGNCFDSLSDDIKVSGELLTAQEKNVIASLSHCSTNNLLNITKCLHGLDLLPTLSKCPPSYDASQCGKEYNFSPEIESYYPEDYIKDNMWDMTHYDYDDTPFDKAYKYHMDNRLPSLDNSILKPHNIIAQPIWKGFGYSIEYINSPDDVRVSQNGEQYIGGWYSDNLQNKDHTLVAGQLNSNDISVDKLNNDLIDDSWVEINDLIDHSAESPMAEKKFNRKQSALRNIQVCLFNRKRIRMGTKYGANVYENNVYENNVIPIDPTLDRFDSRYTNYDCDLAKDQYTPYDISQSIDNRVYTNEGRDWLYFASNLRGNAFETINIFMTLKSFTRQNSNSISYYEGDTKVNDGGRFVYWNPANGPNSFLIVDSPVNIIKAITSSLTLDLEVFPKTSCKIFNSNQYYVVSIKDENEDIRAREYTDNTYINHYGFGDFSTSVYVGGIEGSSSIITRNMNQNEAKTYVKITLYNNVGYDIHMYGSAIEFNQTLLNQKQQINAYEIYNGIYNSIQSPTEYKFLIFDVPVELEEYITIKPSDHMMFVSSLFFDFKNINSVTIRDGFKSDYFVQIIIHDITQVPVELCGKLHSIGVRINTTLFDHFPGNFETDLIYHDSNYKIEIPSIVFGIPYPVGNNKIKEEYWGKVYYSSGVSEDISINLMFADIVDNITSIKAINSSELDEFRSVISQGESIDYQAVSQFYEKLDQQTLITFERNVYGGGKNEIEVKLKDIIIPNRITPYEPPSNSMSYIIKTYSTSLNFGKNIMVMNPMLKYKAVGNISKIENKFISPPYLSRSIYAEGAFLSIEIIDSVLIESINTDLIDRRRRRRSNNDNETIQIIERINQNCYQNEEGDMKITLKVINIGTEIAFNVNFTINFYANIEILTPFTSENEELDYSITLIDNSLMIMKNVDIIVGGFEVFDILIRYKPLVSSFIDYNIKSFTICDTYNVRMNIFDQQSKRRNVLEDSNSVEQTIKKKLEFQYTHRTKDTISMTVLGHNKTTCTIESIYSKVNNILINDRLILIKLFHNNKMIQQDSGDYSITGKVFFSLSEEEEEEGNDKKKMKYDCNSTNIFYVKSYNPFNDLQLAQSNNFVILPKKFPDQNDPEIPNTNTDSPEKILALILTLTFSVLALVCICTVVFLVFVGVFVWYVYTVYSREKVLNLSDIFDESDTEREERKDQLYPKKHEKKRRRRSQHHHGDEDEDFEDEYEENDDSDEDDMDEEDDDFVEDDVDERERDEDIDREDDNDDDIASNGGKTTIHDENDNEPKIVHMRGTQVQQEHDDISAGYPPKEDYPNSTEEEEEEETFGVEEKVEDGKIISIDPNEADANFEESNAHIEYNVEVVDNNSVKKDKFEEGGIFELQKVQISASLDIQQHGQAENDETVQKIYSPILRSSLPVPIIHEKKQKKKKNKRGKRNKKIEGYFKKKKNGRKKKYIAGNYLKPTNSFIEHRRNQLKMRIDGD